MDFSTAPKQQDAPQYPHNDAERLRQSLIDTLETWLPRMLPGGRFFRGEITGIHRTFLTPDGRKAPVEPVKMMLGNCAGGAVRLGVWRPGEMLNVCEGIETGLSAMQLFSLSNMWCALSTSGMRGLELPDGIGGLAIYADRDEAGERAAFALACAGNDKCLGNVKATTPSYPFNDFNDQLMGAR